MTSQEVSPEKNLKDYIYSFEKWNTKIINTIIKLLRLNISNTTDTDDGKQIGKGWGGLLNKENAKREHFPCEQSHESCQAADVEQTLHDNFEELMKEQGKQDYNKGLHK